MVKNSTVYLMKSQNCHNIFIFIHLLLLLLYVISSGNALLKPIILFSAQCYYSKYLIVKTIIFVTKLYNI